MQGSEGVTVNSSPAATTFYVLMNNNPEVGGAFSNPLIQQAVRYALKYDEILALAGPGAVRLAGIIPTVFPGALDPAEATVTDQEKARSLVSEAALDSVTGQLSYASDSVIWGVQMNVLAQKIQSDLAEVGIELALDGLPRTHRAAEVPGRQGPGRRLELGCRFPGRQQFPGLPAGTHGRDARRLAGGCQRRGGSAGRARREGRAHGRRRRARRAVSGDREHDSRDRTVRSALPAGGALRVPLGSERRHVQQRLGGRSLCRFTERLAAL